MPIHDWTRVTAGTFRDIRNAWLVEYRKALNTGMLVECGRYVLRRLGVGPGEGALLVGSSDHAAALAGGRRPARR
jgi:hypothetical protein